MEHGRLSERSVRNVDCSRIQIQMRWSVRVFSLLFACGLGLAVVPENTRAVAQEQPATSACEAQSAGGPVFITENCNDPELSKPYVDERKPGTLTDEASGVSVNFTYVHGGFPGTNARFSFYFPAADKYQRPLHSDDLSNHRRGRCRTRLPEIGTSTCSVVFALSSGAYVVSTNNAGGVPAGGPLAAYRTNAAAAKYSPHRQRDVQDEHPAAWLHLRGKRRGVPDRGLMENTSGVWDGAVPMVFGVPNAIPTLWRRNYSRCECCVTSCRR